MLECESCLRWQHAACVHRWSNGKGKVAESGGSPGGVNGHECHKCNPDLAWKAHRQLNVIECRKIMGMVEESYNPQHQKFASQMRDFSDDVRSFIRKYDADEQAEDTVNLLGMWDFAKVKTKFNPGNNSSRGISAQLTVYCRNVIEATEGKWIKDIQDNAHSNGTRSY